MRSTPQDLSEHRTGSVEIVDTIVSECKMASLMAPIVTLTTEFQEQNPLVAVLKDVLLTECPGVQIIDLSHDIPHGEVMEGALFLAGAIPHFPDGTVHLVDVAPAPTPIAEIGEPLEGVCGSYSDVPAGSPLAMFGGDGFLEVAYNGDRAGQRLRLAKGAVVRLAVAHGTRH